MGGFLDKETRIVDMVLTGLGKRLLSQGDLSFVYWVPFDDEVDYDPYIYNSGSLTMAQMSQSQFDQVEATLVREATSGYRSMNKSGSDYTNVHRPLFNMPQSQRVLPRMQSSFGTGSVELTLEVKQRKVYDIHIRKDQFGNTIEQLGPYDRGQERYESSNVILGYKYAPGSFPPDFNSDGFLVRVYRSGSEGLIEVGERLDSENQIAYGPEIRFSQADTRSKK